MLEDGTLIHATTVVCNADPKVALRLLGDHAPTELRDPPRGLAAPQPRGQVQRRAQPPPELDRRARPGLPRPRHRRRHHRPRRRPGRLRPLRRTARPPSASARSTSRPSTTPAPPPPATTCSPSSASTRPTTSTGTTAARRSRKQFIDLIATYAPDFPDTLEHYEVLGPPDIEAAHRPHRRQHLPGRDDARPDVGAPPPERAPPLKGVYLCGAATHPAGSVIALNGRNAAMAVLEDAQVRADVA